MTMNKLNSQSKVCLICGSDRLQSYKAHASDEKGTIYVNIVECNNCIFGWQYPVGRTEEQSIEFFETAYADEGRTQSVYFNPSRKREIAALEYEFISKLPVKGRTILDIGAGAGIFGEMAADNGWSVTAVDPSLDVSRLKKNPMIKAIKGTIENVPRREVYDIVTMWDVIEHSNNPVELIRSATQRLKNGGWLIIETGNYKSASRVNEGISSWIYQLDHRWYFSPESIKHLLTDAGYAEFTLSDKVLRPGWKGSDCYAGPSWVSLMKWIVRHPLQLRMHLSKYSCLIKAKDWELSGINIFTIAAKKPGRAIC